MKLLVITGPPASGKLTIANEIARRTDFKVFHNHKTIDLYEDILEFGTDEFWEAVHNLRFEIIEVAAKKNINLIFTFCYAVGDEWYIEKFKEITKKYNSNLYFVQLNCNIEELLERVTNKSRKKFNKIKDPEVLKADLNENNFYKTINHKNNIIIYNDNKSASEVANEIIEYFAF